jgi:hypothetical protein
MMTRECARSGDVAAAVVAGEFSCGGESDVRQHVAGCDSCRDLVLVMSALREARARACRDAPLPSAGLVWWRAQLRDRQQAARQAVAPVAAVHAAALLAVILLAVVLVATVARSAGTVSVTDYLPTMPSLGEGGQLVTDPSPLLWYGLALGATAWLILGPVALYFALRRE